MIYLKLKINNFYMFKETQFDFTYPKKIINSTIKNEFLEEFPKINYKKVCIFMGANASGKTSLGKLMCSINNYLAGSAVDSTLNKICNKDKNASIEVVYITPETKEIHKLIAVFNEGGLIEESHKVQRLKKTYSLEKTLESLEGSAPQFTYNQEENHGIENPGFKSVAHFLGYQLSGEIFVWNYTYSDFNTSTKLDTSIEDTILESTLKSFDSSIIEVKKIQESAKNSYIIKFSNNDEVIIEEGKILNHERLSRGTIESIEVAHFINFLISAGEGTFFLDEKMAYSHSEIELSVLNLIIEKLKSNSQLFYTTHNYDVLEMNLPSHSYTFMKKDKFVEVLHPEKMGYTKNDRSLLGYVKNDVFSTLPDTTKIEKLL